ncbi:hypothetical protein Nepgr_022981 [Nepenthes gracilis]|uniref:Uncharacterized protein n=1 Tax=Nepenthes gracilis TaxID=150966 RepID=A0AAD3T241_NEPGR|nr:hypothetical protein Nepgr_022981 [Nepenthes gracilis]
MALFHPFASLFPNLLGLQLCCLALRIGIAVDSRMWIPSLCKERWLRVFVWHFDLLDHLWRCMGFSHDSYLKICRLMQKIDVVRLIVMRVRVNLQGVLFGFLLNAGVNDFGDAVDDSGSLLLLLKCSKVFGDVNVDGAYFDRMLDLADSFYWTMAELVIATVVLEPLLIVSRWWLLNSNDAMDVDAAYGLTEGCHAHGCDQIILLGLAILHVENVVCYATMPTWLCYHGVVLLGMSNSGAWSLLMWMSNDPIQLVAMQQMEWNVVDALLGGMVHSRLLKLESGHALVELWNSRLPVLVVGFAGYSFLWNRCTLLLWKAAEICLMLEPFRYADARLCLVLSYGLDGPGWNFMRALSGTEVSWLCLSHV